MEVNAAPYLNVAASRPSRNSQYDSQKIFTVLTCASGVAMVALLGASVAAVPDSVSLIKATSWSTAVSSSGSTTLYSGLSSFVKENVAGTRAIPYDSAECMLDSICSACSDAFSGTVITLLAAVISAAVALSYTSRRTTPGGASSSDRKMGLASSLTAGASVLYALSNHQSACLNNMEGYTVSSSFGWYALAFAFCVHAASSLAHAFVTPKPASRKFLAQQYAVQLAKRAVVSDVRARNVGGQRRAAAGGDFDISQEAGVLPPVGFWDPLGLSTGKTDARLKWFREAELKHGRVCMLAATGFLLAENYHPLLGGDIDIPSYAAFGEERIEPGFWWPVVVSIAGIEMLSVIFTFKNPQDALWEMKDEHFPGDLGFDPLGLKPSDPEALLEKQNKELQNGRLAMLGFAGMVAQENVDGAKILESPAGLAPKPAAAEVMQVAQDMVHMLNETANMN